MNELELKLRESQHQEEESNASILRSIYDKVTQTPDWARKLPVCFWVALVLLTATMLNTLRLHYVMQAIKTEVSAGLNQEIAELKSAKKAMRSRVLASQKTIASLASSLAKAESQRDEYHNDAHVLFDKRQRERKLLQGSQALAKSLQQQIDSMSYLSSKVAGNYKNSRPSEMRTIYEVLCKRGWNVGNIDSQDLVDR